jgi:uncharacterized repeat protein (TIGR03843 family)
MTGAADAVTRVGSTPCPEAAAGPAGDSLAGASLSHPALTARLEDGELSLTGRLVQASNATFLARLETVTGSVECVYKPIQGERPLWDFPRGTLALREVAAYEISRSAGFDVVPVTVLVDGPLGTGSLQVWVDSNSEDNETLVDVVASSSLPRPGWFEVAEGFDGGDRAVSVVHADVAALRLLAVFDCVINNADRKGGHILSSQGRVFGVDHGICFHTDPKLRTLLWGWAGSPLDKREIAAVTRAGEVAPSVLADLVSEAEIEALTRRVDVLLRRGTFPRPRGGWPTIPWPPF